MTILRHWPGGFSLSLHHTIRKYQAKNLIQKLKNVMVCLFVLQFRFVCRKSSQLTLLYFPILQPQTHRQIHTEPHALPLRYKNISDIVNVQCEKKSFCARKIRVQIGLSSLQCDVDGLYIGWFRRFGTFGDKSPIFIFVYKIMIFFL